MLDKNTLIPDAISWLISDEGSAVLESWRQRQRDFSDLFKLTTALRKEYPVERAMAIANQLTLSEKVKKKFPEFPPLFATEKSFQQATDSAIARYKANTALKGLCAENVRFADLCCGMGGDLLAFAQSVDATGIDADPVTATFAQANCNLIHVKASVLCQTAEETDLSSYNLVHIDPDRRPAGHRTTDVDFFLPPREFIDSLISRVDRVIIKSAPGAKVPELWRQKAQWEWIEHNGECKQAVGWFGFDDRPGETLRATIVTDSGFETFTASAPKRTGVLTFQPTTKSGTSISYRYIYAPTASLSTSGLIPAFCQQYGLTELSPGGYLGADALIDSPFVSPFEIVDDFPLDVKKIKQGLKQKGIECIIIKKRGAVPEPDVMSKKLGIPHSVQPDAPVLLLFEKHAILGVRVN